MDIYGRQPAEDANSVMDCAECGGRGEMRKTHDLTDGLERKCGEVWGCAVCEAEYIDEW